MNNRRADGPVRALVVCEAHADFVIASELADRLTLETIDWVEQELIEHVRSWHGIDEGQAFLAWRDVKDAAARAARHGWRIRPRSRFSGEPGAADAAAADKVLQLAALTGGYDALFLIRDSDGDASRYKGLSQAREGTSWPFAVVLGVANPKREAWVLAGFVPETHEEEERLAAARKALGFDPCERSEELHARTHGAKREAKRVLDAVLGEGCGGPREQACWQKTSLDHLRPRGAHNGLAAYLGEVEARWLPMLKG